MESGEPRRFGKLAAGCPRCGSSRREQIKGFGGHNVLICTVCGHEEPREKKEWSPAPTAS